MPENKIVGYKKVFGFVLPDWVDEKQINMSIGYVLVSLIMIFVLLLVVNPNSDRIKINNESYSTELVNYNNLLASKKSLDDMSTNVDPLQQEAIFQAMPIEYSPEEAVFTLRNLAAVSEVQITEYILPSGVVYDDAKKEFSGAPTKKNEASVKFESYPVQISVSGDINAILKFIDKVEKSLPIGFVSDLGIQEATRISNTANTQVNLKLQITYYQPIMVSFNLGNMQQFSATDIALIKELGLYGQTSFQPTSSFNTPVSSISGSTGVTRNLFGL